MASDDTTTVADLKRAVEQFAEARDWKQFHDPKNLSMALATEAAELMEHFRWVHSENALSVATDPANATDVAAELADIVMFAVEFATICNIDIAEAVEAKRKLNEQRYPIDKAKGTARKYDQL